MLSVVEVMVSRTFKLQKHVGQLGNLIDLRRDLLMLVTMRCCISLQITNVFTETLRTRRVTLCASCKYKPFSSRHFNSRRSRHRWIFNRGEGRLQRHSKPFALQQQISTAKAPTLLMCYVCCASKRKCCVVPIALSKAFRLLAERC